MNIITSTRTYATPANAEKQLTKILGNMGLSTDNVRWLIAVAKDGRFVPAVMLDRAHPEYTLPLVHNGVMVIG